jgi:AraC family transcriptional regulator of adaptative response/methylated-DNA-[protein]-cysteine methyltransferase
MLNLMTNATDFISDASRWQAVMQRSASADRAFVYAVATTGIFCRPTCSSRRPNRENTHFFDDGSAATAAGFRACKRCRPMHDRETSTAAQAVVRACELIETSENEPTLVELAQAVGLSPSYFQRLFKQAVGLSPKQYAIERRRERLRGHLQSQERVSDAVYEAGFESGSRFYETAERTLGMTPRAYQKGGSEERIRYGTAKSYLGWVLVAASDRGVCQIDIGSDTAELETRLKSRFPEANFLSQDPDFGHLLEQTLAFLDTPEQGHELPLDIQGTAFQRRVWQALQDIQPGQTASYGHVARAIGQPKASRAVAQACGANTLAVAIPCHRVVRSGGGLGGYRWGIERKQQLLEREQRG